MQSFPERHSNAPKHGWGEFKAQTLQRQLGGSHSSSVSQEHLPSFHTKNSMPNEGKTTPLHRNQKDKLVMNVHIHYHGDRHQTQASCPSLATFPAHAMNLFEKRRHIFQDYFKWVSLLSWSLKSKTTKAFHLSLESSASEIAPNPSHVVPWFALYCKGPQATLQPLLPRLFLICLAILFLFPALLLAFPFKISKNCI